MKPAEALASLPDDILAPRETSVYRATMRPIDDRTILPSIRPPGGPRCQDRTVEGRTPVAVRVGFVYGGGMSPVLEAVLWIAGVVVICLGLWIVAVRVGDWMLR